MKKFNLIIFNLLSAILLSSCCSPSGMRPKTGEDFQEVNLMELRVLVTKTRSSELWTYHGKDEEYHYLAREPRTKPFGGRGYLHVKLDADSIDLGDHSKRVEGHPHVL
jgi:hypothetical protein